MARIRSVHPGLWTDPEFVGLSIAARLFFIGIWNEADDYGLFEWKPLTLKMRLAPVDNVDAGALLEEIEAAGRIERIERAGKVYGLVRNFRKYQRPKAPSEPIIPLEPGIISAIALPSNDPRFPKDGEILPQTYPSHTEKRALMEDGGDKREEIRVERNAAAASAAPVELDLEPPASLDRLCQEAMSRWNTMAAEIGLAQAKQLTEPRRKALKARLGECGGLDGWDAALKKVRESRFLRGDSRDGWRADLDFVLQAKSFTKLIEGAYDNRDAPAQRRNFAEPVPSSEQPWERRIENFKQRKIWVGTWGPQPDQPGCFAPKPILQQYGYGQGEAA